jgi:hypothetical protein
LGEAAKDLSFLAHFNWPTLPVYGNYAKHYCVLYVTRDTLKNGVICHADRLELLIEVHFPDGLIWPAGIVDAVFLDELLAFGFGKTEHVAMFDFVEILPNTVSSRHEQVYALLIRKAHHKGKHWDHAELICEVIQFDQMLLLGHNHPTLF